MHNSKTKAKENIVFSFLKDIIENSSDLNRFRSVTQFRKAYSGELAGFSEEEIEEFMDLYSEGIYNGEFPNDKRYFDELTKYVYEAYYMKPGNGLFDEYQPALFPSAKAREYTGNNSLDFTRSKISHALLHKFHKD